MYMVTFVGLLYFISGRPCRKQQLLVDICKCTRSGEFLTWSGTTSSPFGPRPFGRPVSSLKSVWDGCRRKDVLLKTVILSTSPMQHPCYMLNIEVLFPGPSCFREVERGQAFAFEWKQVSATGDRKWSLEKEAEVGGSSEAFWVLHVLDWTARCIQQLRHRCTRQAPSYLL